MLEKRVLLVNEGVGTEDVLHALSGSSHCLVGSYQQSNNLIKKVNNEKPDVLVITTNYVNASLLSEINVVFAKHPLPIVLFSSDARESSIKKAVKAGVTSYIFDGLEENRIDPIIQMAMLRFNETLELKTAVMEAEQKLTDRIIVDRAKGMLMDTQGMKEQEAYRALQKTAMDKATTIVDIAERTIAMFENMRIRRTA